MEETLGDRAPIGRLASALAVALALLTTVPAASVEQPRSHPAEKLALVGGLLLDGWGGAPVQNGAILIEGDRITAAGSASQIAIPPDARVVDTSGRTMMPGLIEAVVKDGKILKGAAPALRTAR